MKKSFYKYCFCVLLSFFVVAPSFVMISSAVMAQSTPAAGLTVADSTTTVSDKNAFVATICNVLKIVTGNGGKAFAAFAIISLGIGFFTGKVSWGLMIGVAAGIAAMFGAPTIVAAVSGTTSYDCRSANI